MKVLVLALTLSAGAVPLTAQAAPKVGGTLPAAELTALEALRKDIWVQWFTGDTAALRRELSPELVAVSPDGPHWFTLQQSLDGSARYKASGAQFLSVDFDSSMVHRFGDVVVMFSHYTVVTEKSGKRSTTRGRATELFVRNNGKWVHTSWHIDEA
jgi:ketosteroid isomerase-like protein